MSENNRLTDIRCYGCDSIGKESQFLYICNCYYEEGPKYRGVCKFCIENRVTIKLPYDHNLSYNYKTNVNKKLF